MAEDLNFDLFGDSTEAAEFGTEVFSSDEDFASFLADLNIGADPENAAKDSFDASFADHSDMPDLADLADVMETPKASKRPKREAKERKPYADALDFTEDFDPTPDPEDDLSDLEDIIGTGKPKAPVSKDPLDIDFSLSDLEEELREMEAPRAESAQRSTREKSRKPDENDPPKKAKSSAGSKKKKKKKCSGRQSALNAVLLLIALALLVGIGAILYRNIGSDPFRGKILKNVYVAGVDVGGMTKKEALAAVKSAVGTSYWDNDMVVHIGETDVVFSAASTRANLDAESAVEAAFALGRSGTPAERQQTYRISQSSKITLDLAPMLGLNTDYIRSILGTVVSSIGDNYTPSDIHIDGEMPKLNADDFSASAPCQTITLTLGTPKSHTNVNAIYNQVIEAYSNCNFQLTIPPETVAQYPEKLDLDALHAELTVAPVEAVEDPTTKEITPGSCGYTFSLEDAKEQLAAANYGDVITIPLEYVFPANLDFNGTYVETLGTYSTEVGGNDAYIQNMKLVCKALDGTILQPGDTFSFNTVVGSRNAQNGYQNAICHPGYCVDEAVGGGADQCATTLYVAALLADMNITQKNPGDHVCGYTIKGTEITVAQNWHDLKFRNTLDRPVKIRARVNSTHVIVSILAETPLNYTVKVESEVGNLFTPNSISVQKKSDSGFKDGDVATKGLAGGLTRVNITKVDKESGKEISKRADVVELRASSKITVVVR